MHRDRRRKLLGDSGADCVLLVNIEGSSRPSLIYYTGFTGTFATLLLMEKEEWLITDPRYTEQASKQTDVEVIEYRAKEKFTEFLSNFVIEKKCEKIGIEKSRISLSFFEEFSKNLKGVEFVSVDKIVRSHRMVKEPEELERIKKAIEIAQNAFLETLNYVKPGMTEKEVAAYLEYKMKSLGADGVAFESIIASGPRSALPHGIASSRKIEPGDIIVFDFGAVYEGYVSDITRMVSMGTPKEEVLRVHEVVRKAQDLAVERAKPGMKGREIDLIAREYLENVGYEKEFGHGLGHGIGLEVHEYPSISRFGEDDVSPGMVFTIEPGVYIEGAFGIRLEEDVVMRENGVEVLTSLDREIFVLEG